MVYDLRSARLVPFVLTALSLLSFLSHQGGLGVVPGFGWWPIKAYRPCPAFVEAGGRYKRQGQSLDEVAFGRKGKDDDLDIGERLKG